MPLIADNGPPHSSSLTPMVRLTAKRVLLSKFIPYLRWGSRRGAGFPAEGFQVLPVFRR